jgi:excisionase family DNA binding protein
MMPYPPPIPSDFPDQSTMPDLADYVTVREAAEQLGFHVLSVYRLAREGKLKSLKVGHALFIEKTAITSYQQATEGKNKHDPSRSEINDE